MQPWEAHMARACDLEIKRREAGARGPEGHRGVKVHRYSCTGPGHGPGAACWHLNWARRLGRQSRHCASSCGAGAYGHMEGLWGWQRLALRVAECAPLRATY